jgi:hypothetical protein
MERGEMLMGRRACALLNASQIMAVSLQISACSSEAASVPVDDETAAVSGMAVQESENVRDSILADNPAAAASDFDLNAPLLDDARGVDMLVGTWASSPAECASEFAVTFEQQLYRDHAGSGPWRAEGDTIVIDYQTDPAPRDGRILTAEIRLKVSQLSPGRVMWQDRTAQPQSLILCQ